MPDKRREAYLIPFIMALSSCVPAGCSRDHSDKRGADDHNVLLVTLDTFRKTRLSCYGHSVETSPNFDALAEDGIKFDHAIVQAGVTPVSHASILTGLNPYQHGVRVMHAASGYRLPESVSTLATVLKEAGYRTGAFLSSFAVSEHFGFDRGFDVFDNGLDGNVEEKIRQGKDGNWRWDVRANQRRSDDTTEVAIKWLKNTPRPFFGWIHYWDPHDSLLQPPQEIVQRFVSPQASNARRRLQLYDSEIFYPDLQFGRVVQTLKDLNEYENTIIILIADHGQGLDDGWKNHGWYLHRMLYREQIDAPFIMRVPGGPKGLTVPDLVRSIDIFPTVLGLLDISHRGPVDGESLCGLIADRPEPPRFAYADALNLWDLNAVMIRQRPDADLLYCSMDSDWKLIYHRRRPGESELYHLKHDPKELRNVYKEQPAQARRLLARLESVDCFVDKPFPALTTGDSGYRDALERLESLGYLGGVSNPYEEENEGRTTPVEPPGLEESVDQSS
jgi:arylsulfatase A-like enzyme